MRLAHAVAGALCGLLVCNAASAGVVTVEFSGFVSPQSLLIPDELEGLLGAGDSVVGRYRYDDSQPDANPDPRYGFYVYLEPEFFLEVTIGSVHLGTDPEDPDLWLQILDGYPLGIAPNGIDRYGVSTRFAMPWNLGPLEPTVLHFFLSDLSLSALSSDALPATLPPLSAFMPPGGGLAQGQISDATLGSPIFVNFSVVEWHVVPEPASLSLLLLPFALLALRLRGPARSRPVPT